MKYIGAILSIWFVLSTQGAGAAETAHQFGRDQCGLCHRTAAGSNEAMDLPSVAADICVACHSGMTGSMSHPVDITPEDLPPTEMPLVNGRLSCLTCHFVHPTSLKANVFRRSLLRKTGMGAQFCVTCHQRGANEHTLFEKAHPDSQSYTGQQLALDTYTLQCVQCHDGYLRLGRAVVDSAEWRCTASGLGQHPVGVVLADVASKNPKKFNPPSLISEQMRLYDSKIGCGTCHSAYSEEKNMLVTDNHSGGLCLQCHIK